MRASLSYISSPFRCSLVLLSLATLAIGLSTVCRAGGGPENIFLLVNSNSVDSMTVANHYVDLRQIPPENVFYLNWKRPVTQTFGKLFREEILMPALKEIEKRKLGAQVDYLIYSCDFPWRVCIQRGIPRREVSTAIDAYCLAHWGNLSLAVCAGQTQGDIQSSEQLLLLSTPSKHHGHTCFSRLLHLES